MGFRVAGSSNEMHDDLFIRNADLRLRHPPMGWARWQGAAAATGCRLLMAGWLAALAVSCGSASSQPSAAEQAKASPVSSQPSAVEQAPAPPAPAGTSGAAQQVQQASAEEMRRRRAEWREQQRMAEQAQANLDAWRRSRNGGGGAGATPRVSSPSTQVPLQNRDDLSENTLGGIKRSTGREAPQGGDDAAAGAMRTWYQAYRARAAAVSTALSQLGTAASAAPPDQAKVLAACRDLRASSQALLEDQTALAAPIETVSRPLATAYGELRATADACLALRQDEQAAHLATARLALSEAGAALRPYHMSP